MSSVRSLTVAVAVVFASLLVQPATKANTIIDFGGLSGSNGAVLGAYNEDGFLVSPTAGSFREAHFFGNPLPSIDNDDGLTDTIAITSTSGALFQFIGLDYGCGGSSSTCGYSAIGSLGGSQVFSFSDPLGVANTGLWYTRASLNTSIIDKLELTITAFDSNFDNIVLGPVATPLPATLPLLASGLGALGLLGWRRKRKAQAAA